MHKSQELKGKEDMKTRICEILDIDFPLVAFSHCRDVVEITRTNPS
jgi:hypothetical protein